MHAIAQGRDGRQCDFCPKNYFSDGTEECEPCAPGTAPDYEYSYQWWTQKLPNIETKCISVDGKSMIWTIYF